MLHYVQIYIHNDRLCNTAINRDQQTWYRYDTGGNRTRKISQSGPHLFKERIYFSNFEIYRERSVDGEIITERLTNHIADGSRRIAMVDSLTIDHGHPIEPVTTIRYQYDNHLGSACLELDERAEIISYEEYHPFGTTSYRSGRSLTETSLKRYKYVGKKRDEETGFYYYGARYYAAWLCRFVSVDPLQHKYPHYTPYQYAGNKPVSYIDLDGLEEAKFSELFFENFRQGLEKETVLNNKTSGNSNTVQKTAVTDATKRVNPYKDKAASAYSELNKTKSYLEMKMPGVSQSQKDQGSISPAMSNLEKWAGIMIAPETRNMVEYDPVFKAVSTGGLAFMASPLFTAEFSATSAASGLGDFAAQMTFKQDINQWNIIQTASTMFFKLPVTQAFVGSAGEITPNNIFNPKVSLGQRTIFGKKTFTTLGVESTIGTFFNYTGNQSVKGLGINNSFGKTGAETYLYYLNYSISTGITNPVNKNLNNQE